MPKILVVDGTTWELSPEADLREIKERGWDCLRSGEVAFFRILIDHQGTWEDLAVNGSATSWITVFETEEKRQVHFGA